MKVKGNKEEFREEFRLLGLRIAYYRKKVGLTQGQLAEELGCSLSFLGQLEANNGNRIHAPSLLLLFRMAKLFDIPVSKLFEE